jgi:hypothetical protein
LKSQPAPVVLFAVGSRRNQPASVKLVSWSSEFEALSLISARLL